MHQHAVGCGLEAGKLPAGKQGAAVKDATSGQELATINALLKSLRDAGIIAKQ